MLRFNTLSNFNVNLQGTVRNPTLPTDPPPPPTSLADLDRLDEPSPDQAALYWDGRNAIQEMQDRAAELKALDNTPGDLNPEKGVVVIRSKPSHTISGDEILTERDGETRLVTRATIDIGRGAKETKTREYVQKDHESAMASRCVDGAGLHDTIDQVYQQDHAAGTIAVFY